MSTETWSQWTAGQAPRIALVTVLLTLVAVRLAGGGPFRFDDLAVLGGLVLGLLVLILTVRRGVRPRRSVGLTEPFQSVQEADESRRLAGVRGWFEAHSVLDRLYRVVTVACLFAALAGALLSWRHGAPYSPWPHLANMFAIVLIGLRGPSSIPRRPDVKRSAP